ncbi:Cyclic nucleotide-gated ion channel 4 [Citrus sinensis]|nr:Cyclic nucleotide-gated ion channel 4 [Citrus sinensis]
MASTEQEISRAARVQYYTTTDDDSDDKEEEEEEMVDEEEQEEEEGEVEERCKNGRRRDMFSGICGRRRRSNWSFGQVLDPRAKWVQEWNRVFLLVCATGLFVDPLFFYALSISETCMCLFVDGWFAITVTALRCMTDLLHVWNMWLQLKMTKAAYGVGGAAAAADDEDKRPRSGPHSRSVALRYMKAKKGFFFDLFVILPLPQVTSASHLSFYACNTAEVAAVLMRLTLGSKANSTMGCDSGPTGEGINNAGDDGVLDHVPLPIPPQDLPLSLPVAAYAKSFGLHLWNRLAAGACWYLLGIQRSAKCLREQCREMNGCDLRLLSCKEPIYYGTTDMVRDRARLAWAENKQARSTCIESSNNYDYGAYKWTVQLVTNVSRLEKILFPIFWGLMTLSTFGNLESTTEWLEVVFNIIVLTSGLLLVTMLIGNIKVFLHATTSKKQAMQLKMRNIEWWMRKRQLPQGFRQRVRNYERQRWAAMRGVDECEMISNLPEGLRRDIKYHLCLDLVRQVPLFQHMDDLVLENICDRVKSLIFTKGEVITKEGDPVQRMLFVVRGHLQSSQILHNNIKSCCMLGPGNFSGDELLSWCLRRPFIERLPPSSSTLITLETTEAFGLEAEDVKYVTQHFRYTFVKEKVKRSARYYSPGWRTWAAVAIQLAWRRYKHRLTLTSLSFIRPRRPLSRCSSLGEDRLRLYTALLTSPKPNQDDFDF